MAPVPPAADLAGSRPNIVVMMPDDIAADNPEIVERLQKVFDEFWADARPYMVNEKAPMEREIVRPYWELYEKHIGPMPELPDKAKKPRKNRKKKEKKK